jgi:hypothetical protein
MALLTAVTLSLAGCNLPRVAPTGLPMTSQRQTEIAGILNPQGLNTQVSEPPTGSTASTDVPTPIPTEMGLVQLEGYLLYPTRWGDTLPALALRFDVEIDQILSPIPLDPEALLPSGLTLQIPDLLVKVLPYTSPLLPDSEVIYGPTAGDFNATEFARSAGGFLAYYTEKVHDEPMSGPDILARVALETSTNPRLLLAFLEYRSGWVFSFPPGAGDDPYPIGYGASDIGLYDELMITAKLLAQGFYGWREGSFLDLSFYQGEYGRLSPMLNAGSVALMHLFATLYDQATWETHLLGASSFLNFYQEMFGDYWERAVGYEPAYLAPEDFPILNLPFQPGEAWSLTAGPHITWETGTPRGALDFAPITGEPHCAISVRWVTAAAPGLVVRSNNSTVAIDLDGDGNERTGWVLIYYHIPEEDRVPVGMQLPQDALIGHPSCEGGQATGTHLHFTRKFDGEWVGINSAFPLVLSGWQAFAGEKRYEGYLQKGDLIVTSRPDGSHGSTIIRDN